jgi:hypothetical protein
MTPSRRYRTRQQNATARRLQQATARLQREPARAPRELQALAQAIRAWGLPATVVEAVAGRWQAPGTRLSQILGVLFPPRVGWRPADERSRVRGGDQHGPTRLLGAWPKRTWVQRWQPLGRGRLGRWWRPVEDHSPATRSRWPWTWGRDDRVVKTAGPQWPRGASMGSRARPAGTPPSGTVHCRPRRIGCCVSWST